jgi:O-antigen ligase
MPSPSEIANPPEATLSAPATVGSHLLGDPANWPVAVLALTMFLLPALGVPNELMLQDSLKSAIAAFGVLAAALLFFWQQRQRTEPLLWHGMVWLPLVLMLYALGSMMWSHSYLAGVEAIRWFILSLLMWLGLNSFTRQNLTLLIWGIHAGAVLASLWVVLQFWFDLSLFPQAAPPSSTFVNRNFFAEYAVAVLPFSVYLLANFRASRWLPVVALSVALSVALNVVALMMTGTRSALIALLLLLPMLTLILIRYRQQFAFAQWSRAKQALVGMVLVIGVSGMGSVPSGNTTVLQDGAGATALQRSFHRAASMTERQEYTEGSFSVRSQMWMATARMMIANPWTGVGAGAWEVQIPLYQRNNTTLETDYYAHNEWLQLLSEYGLLVGGLVLAVWLAYGLKSVGNTRAIEGTNRDELPLRAISLAGLLALLIVSSAGFALHLAACGVLLALCLGILTGSDARLGNQQTFFASKIGWQPAFSHALLLALAACITLATYITWQAVQAEHQIVQAMHWSAQASRLASSNPQASEEAKAQALQAVKEGIAINPHYRRFTALVAEMLSARGDWVNAVWVLETLTQSRPNVVALWSALANGYSILGQHTAATQALQQVKRLKPDALATVGLEVSLLSRAGHDDQATTLLVRHFDQSNFSYEMLEMGYEIGYKTRNWVLAIRSLELRNLSWPQQAADGHMRLGKIYAGPDLHDEVRASQEFQKGLSLVPDNEKENYRSQVPVEFRLRM